MEQRPMYLNVIQAKYGDCMILVSGSSKQPANKTHYFLIDGGPASTYNASLKKELQKIKNKRGKEARETLQRSSLKPLPPINI
jgi:hypothetical protein